MGFKTLLVVALGCLTLVSADPIQLDRQFKTFELRRPVGVCPQIDGQSIVYLKDAYNCQVFYQCMRGIPVQKECLLGHCFDITQNTCIHPAPTEAVKADECLPPADSTCKPDHNCTPIPDDPVGTCPDPLPHSPCVHAIYLPHRDNCQYFYQCVHRTPVQMCCPANTCFNVELNICA